MPSMPFEPDKPAPLRPLPKSDPVRDGARAFRKQLAQDYQAELAELRSYAVSEWQKFRSDNPFADNRDEYVAHASKSWPRHLEQVLGRLERNVALLQAEMR